MDIAHFALGAALTSIIVTFLIPTVWYPRSLILIGGGWAMLPDVHRISPIGVSQLRAIHESAWADVFWFHWSLDHVVDPTDSELFAAVLLASLIVTTIASEHRSYRAPKPIREAILGESPAD